MPHDVVISYSRRNREIADRLADILKERGIEAWYDRMIDPGEDWRDEIARAIAHARVFLILFSAESNASQELKKELAIADRRELYIIPVRVDDVEPEGLFEYELARRQRFDIFQDWRAGLPEVADHVANAVHATKRKQTTYDGKPEPTLAGVPAGVVEEPVEAPQSKRTFKPSRPEPPFAPARTFGWRPPSMTLPIVGMVLAALLLAFHLASLPSVLKLIPLPVWSLLQVVKARQVGAGGTWTSWVRRFLTAYAIVSVGTAALFLAALQLGVYELIAIAQVANMAMVFVALALIGVVWRDARSSIWLLPLLGSAIATYQWMVSYAIVSFVPVPAAFTAGGILLSAYGFHRAARGTTPSSPARS